MREQEPWRERAEPNLVTERVHWIVEVTERARTAARETMREVRDAMACPTSAGARPRAWGSRARSEGRQRRAVRPALRRRRACALLLRSPIRLSAPAYTRSMFGAVARDQETRDHQQRQRDRVRPVGEDVRERRGRGGDERQGTVAEERAMISHVASVATPSRGSIPSTAPAAVATPLPPLKRRTPARGDRERRRARPARPSPPPSHKRGRSGRPAPPAEALERVEREGEDRRCLLPERSTLVAPGLPEP